MYYLYICRAKHNLKKMKHLEVQKILKEKTLNLFSNDWYRNTSDAIIHLLNPSDIEKYGDEKLFYEKCNELFVVNTKYYNQDINKYFEKFNYSSKRNTLLIKNWAFINNYIYTSKNINGKRYFYIIK